MLNKIISTFYNVLYRIRPPHAVSYWKNGGTARAKKIRNKDGSYGMRIEGEKYDYPGFPRDHVLSGSFSRLKKGLKHHMLNTAFAAMEKMADDTRVDMLPKEHMVPAVRHIWETFEKMEDCEVVPDMKARIRLMKIIFAQICQEDDAYRMRAQMFFWLIDQKKIKLSEADMHYARGKYFRPDRYTKVFGKVYDKFTY